MFDLLLIRHSYGRDGTYGVLLLPGYGQYATAECPWVPKDATGKDWPFGLDKKSCVPEGVYRLQADYSPSQKTTRWYLVGEGVALHALPGNPVEWRDRVMIHPANYPSELMACIAPGMFYDPVSGAVRRSADAVRQIEAHLHKLASPALRITSTVRART